MKWHTQAAHSHIFNTNSRKLLQAQSQSQSKAQADRQCKIIPSTQAIALSSFAPFATAFH